MEQIQYQSFDTNEGFNPTAQVDFIPTLDRKHRRLNQADEAALQQVRRNNQVKVNNAKNAGSDLVALSKFSAKLTKLATDISKSRQEDIEAAETVNYLFGGNTSETTNDNYQQPATYEDSTVEALEREADAVSTGTQAVESQTDAATANAWRSQYSSVNNGVVSESVLLTQARSMYGSYMHQYFQSDQKIGGVPVRELLASGDTRNTMAVLAEGRRQFFRDMRLSGVSKTGLAKSLVPTVIATDAQLANSYTSASIKANREATIGQLSGAAFADAKAGQATPETIWRSAADNLFRANTGLTRGQANKAALESVLNGYIESGNTDAIEQLLSVRQRPDQAGTELGRGANAELIYEALGKAEAVREGVDQEKAEATEQRMYQELSQAPDDDARRVIIERYAQQLESQGLYRQAHALRNQVSQLQLAGNKQANEAEIQEAIDAGGDVTQEFLDKARDNGSISRQAYDRFTRAIQPLNYTKNDTFKDTTKSLTKEATENFLMSVGLKKDGFGNIIKAINGQSEISESAGTAITGAMVRDMEEVATSAVTSLGVTEPAEVEKVITETLKQWQKDNLWTPGGKYYVGDIRDIRLNNKVGADIDKQRGAIQQRLRALNTANGLTGSYNNRSLRSAVTSKDFSTDYEPGVSMPDGLKRDFRFNRGDKLFTESETKEYLEEYERSGNFNAALVETAKQLGVSELKLLNSQLKANKLDTIKPTLNPAPQRHLLMSLGVPSSNATYLSSKTTFQPNSVPKGFGQTIAAAAAKEGIDPAILAGLLDTESGYRDDVISGQTLSSAGAVGIAQIMREYHPNVNPLNPTESIYYAANYLKRLLDMFGGDYRLAITAYNAGEGNVQKYGGAIPGNAESQGYYPKVIKNAGKYGYGGNAVAQMSNPEYRRIAMNPKATQRQLDRIGGIAPLDLTEYGYASN